MILFAFEIVTSKVIVDITDDYPNNHTQVLRYWNVRFFVLCQLFIKISEKVKWMNEKRSGGYLFRGQSSRPCLCYRPWILMENKNVEMIGPFGYFLIILFGTLLTSAVLYKLYYRQTYFKIQVSFRDWFPSDLIRHTIIGFKIYKFL